MLKDSLEGTAGEYDKEVKETEKVNLFWLKRTDGTWAKTKGASG